MVYNTNNKKKKTNRQIKITSGCCCPAHYTKHPALNTPAHLVPILSRKPSFLVQNISKLAFWSPGSPKIYIRGPLSTNHPPKKNKKNIKNYTMGSLACPRHWSSLSNDHFPPPASPKKFLTCWGLGTAWFPSWGCKWHF